MGDIEPNNEVQTLKDNDLNVSTHSTEQAKGQDDPVTEQTKSNAPQGDDPELMIEYLTNGFSAELLPQLQELRKQTEEIT